MSVLDQHMLHSQASPSDKQTFRIAHDCLSNWLERHVGAYRELFELGLTLSSGLSGDPGSLLELGFVESVDDVLIAPRCVYPYDGLFVLCDRPNDPALDRVFSVFQDESLLLAEWVDVERGDTVLDIGTGSGIVALLAAKRGATKVFASDINDRVRKYFEMNLLLNGFSDIVEYVHSDVFRSFDRGTFDVIVANPPFVPVPRGCRFFLHSDGGPFGTKIVERIVEESPSFLSDRGRLNLVSLSLGGPTGLRITEICNRTAGTDSGVPIWIAPIYREEPIDIGRFTQTFRLADNFREWVGEFRAMGYEHLGFYAVHLGHYSVASHRRLEIACARKGADLCFWESLGGSMERRLARYKVPQEEIETTSICIGS